MDTARIMERVGFDSAFIFVYSERKGTVARRRWKDDVPPEEKSYRSVYLNDLQKDVSRKRNEAHIGQVHEIMVEGPSKKSETDWFGRNDGNKMVIFPRNNQKPGDYIKVRMTTATANTLKGTVAG